MLEDFKNGDRELRERLNELLAVARKIDRMSGDEHIKVRHTANGINISMERIPKTAGGMAGVRKAYVKTTPAAVATVACYLDTDATGTEVTVTCEIIGGTKLNEAIPQITDGKWFYVVHDNGTWRSLFPFQTYDTDQFQITAGVLQTKLDECA